MQEIRHFLIGNFLHFTAGVNIKPKWNGTGWISGATAEELAVLANLQNQASQPSSEQMAINQLGMMVASLSARVAKTNA